MTKSYPDPSDFVCLGFFVPLETVFSLIIENTITGVRLQNLTYALHMAMEQ